MEEEFDVRGEVARVHLELVAFRDECLPVLLHPDAPPSRFEERDRSTRQWREAVDRLLTALPISPTGEGEAPPERADFEPFLEPSASAFPPVVVGGRIAWRVELFMGWEWGAEQVLSLLDSRTPGLEPLEGLRRDLTEVKRRLMALPTDECHLYNLLCYSLPPIADIDPAFAALALDPETWRAIVLADRGLDEEIRGRRLRAVDGLYFHHVLNNALLHVMGSLANNHFDVVRDRLDHPDLLGRYTALMPRYLFAVLFEKVRVLHGFARSESDDLT